MLDELAASEPDEAGVSVATTVPWKTGGVGAARFRTLAAKDALHDFVRRARGGSGATHADGGAVSHAGHPCDERGWYLLGVAAHSRLREQSIGAGRSIDQRRSIDQKCPHGRK